MSLQIWDVFYVYVYNSQFIHNCINIYCIIDVEIAKDKTKAVTVKKGM